MRFERAGAEGMTKATSVALTCESIAAPDLRLEAGEQARALVLRAPPADLEIDQLHGGEIERVGRRLRVAVRRHLVRVGAVGELLCLLGERPVDERLRRLEVPRAVDDGDTADLVPGALVGRDQLEREPG